MGKPRIAQNPSRGAPVLALTLLVLILAILFGGPEPQSRGGSTRRKIGK